MEFLHHIGELFLRTARITGRTVRIAGRVIKAPCVAPIVDLLHAKITDGTPLLIDRIEGQGVFHGAGALVSAGFGLQLIDRHQLDGGDAQAL